MNFSCSLVEALANKIVVLEEPGGATTTQRLSCSGWYVSSIKEKDSFL
jgi:hypothetical protein